MSDVQATKRKYASEILKNDTYLQDSGLVERLRDQLLKMSKDDLACLAMIVGMKCKDAKASHHDMGRQIRKNGKMIGDVGCDSSVWVYNNDLFLLTEIVRPGPDDENGIEYIMGWNVDRLTLTRVYTVEEDAR